ncbi:uncharacterized protein LOC108026090 [Drosophila biarmipes]|uniref:uncharacterized protein LOC108026090 n=1 Tax=Drosophila biarmipes TaxID=125945 RepID=UPI0007E6DA30|nr:uncharacterized protein LOC108026090 [Drosophila biarmipes]
MMYFVRIISVAIAIVSFLGVVFGSHDGSTTFGVLKKGARLLHKEEIVVPRKFFRVVEKKINFQPQLHKISAIVITDNSESKGGKASLLEGGPTANFAVILFKSARNRGLNFTLEIFDVAPDCFRCKTSG